MPNLKQRIEPQAGQESVWDYPRPPRLEPTTKLLKVVLNNVVIAETVRGFRVLETSHPPVYYFPPSDVRLEFFDELSISSLCEWKGRAGYYSIAVHGRLAPKSAWFYLKPTPEFAAIAQYVAFYPSKFDACFVNDELVSAQEGDFYGGWITSDIIGPFKGADGTWGW